jgi:hypothetical protein
MKKPEHENKNTNKTGTRLSGAGVCPFHLNELSVQPPPGRPGVLTAFLECPLIVQLSATFMR